MPRERAKLSDKQEKILMQAMLMGLDARDMQQIGNRLMALKKEAEDKAAIADNTQGFTWEKVSLNDWKITTPEGFVVSAVRGHRGKSSWDSYNWCFDIEVTKPGTRFKPRKFKEKSLYISYDWKKKFMPENSKELYALIKWANAKHWEYQ